MPTKKSKPAKKKGGKKGKKKSSKPPKEEVDILSPEAIETASYMCDSAAQCLAFRGFGWPKSQKKKKKGGKKKKK